MIRTFITPFITLLMLSALIVSCAGKLDRIPSDNIDIEIIDIEGEKYVDIKFDRDVKLRKATVIDITGQYIEEFAFDLVSTTSIQIPAKELGRGMNLIKFDIEGYKDVDDIFQL